MNSKTNCQIKKVIAGFLSMFLALSASPLPSLQAAELLSSATELTAPTVSASSMPSSTSTSSLPVLSSSLTETSPLSPATGFSVTDAQAKAVFDFSKRVGVAKDDPNIYITRLELEEDGFFYVDLAYGDGKVTGAYQLGEENSKLLISSLNFADASNADNVRYSFFAFSYDTEGVLYRVYQNTDYLNQGWIVTQRVESVSWYDSNLISFAESLTSIYDLSTAYSSDAKEQTWARSYYSNGKLNKRITETWRYLNTENSTEVSEIATGTEYFVDGVITSRENLRNVYDLSTADTNDFKEQVWTKTDYVNGKMSNRLTETWRYLNTAISSEVTEIVTSTELFVDGIIASREVLRNIHDLTTENWSDFKEQIWTKTDYVNGKISSRITETWRYLNTINSTLVSEVVTTRESFIGGVVSQSESVKYVYNISTPNFDDVKEIVMTWTTFQNGVKSHVEMSGAFYDSEGNGIGSYSLQSDYDSTGKLLAQIGYLTLTDGKQYSVIYEISNGSVLKTRVFDEFVGEITSLGGAGFISPRTILKKILKL